MTLTGMDASSNSGAANPSKAQAILFWILSKGNHLTCVDWTALLSRTWFIVTSTMLPLPSLMGWK